MDDKLYLVTYDAVNEWSYPEDDMSFTEVFGVFSNINIAREKIHNFINAVESMANAKSLTCGVTSGVTDSGDEWIDLGINGVRDIDISGFHFYIQTIDMDTSTIEPSSMSCLKWLSKEEN